MFSQPPYSVTNAKKKSFAGSVVIDGYAITRIDALGGPTAGLFYDANSDADDIFHLIFTGPVY